MRGRKIPQFFHIFYFDTQKGYLEKSQFEGKGLVFSFSQVEVEVRAGNSHGNLMLESVWSSGAWPHQECLW